MFSRGSGGEAQGGAGSETVSESNVPTQLTSLVPQFDPSQHDLEQYTHKVEMLSEIWPASKMNELVTRLILNTSGAAFQKLQLRRSALLTGTQAGVEELIKTLGGQWGKISLERKYEVFEKALFRCSQKSDETNDSFLARCDVVWSELLASATTLQEVQAYVILRGSQLSAEDKKRVVLESEAAKSGILDMTKVTAAVRTLGSGFFQEMTAGRKTKGKVYDTTTFHVEDEESESAFVAEEWNEEEAIEQLAGEGDDDAVLVCEYESAIQDTIQEDAELAATYNAYSDARRRLNDRFKNRGFWPTSYGKGKKGKTGKGKGKGFGKRRKSLQQRILGSECRICHKIGHWKAECPERNRAPNSGSQTTAAPTLMTMTGSSNVDPADMLTLEFLQLPEVGSNTVDEPRQQEVFVVCHSPGIYQPHNGGKLWGNYRINPKYHQAVQGNAQPVQPVPRNEQTNQPEEMPLDDRSSKKDRVYREPISFEPILFVTHGTYGIVDSGATKTVIGSEWLPDLLQQLCPEVRRQVRRCRCEVTFRFGNQGTLDSQQALVIPIGKLGLKIAIVPGKTPLLLSNTLLRTLKAKLDAYDHCLLSPFVKKPINLKLSSRGLFLMDINELALNARSSIPEAETYVQDVLDHRAISQIRQPTHPAAAASATLNNNPVIIQQPNQTEPKIPNPTQTFDVTFKSDVSETALQQPEPLSNTNSQSGPEIVPALTSSSGDSHVELPRRSTFKEMSLEEMGLTQVAFGKAQMGKTYVEVWESESSWLRWFVKTYESSNKVEHQKLIWYTQLRIERAELEMESAAPMTSSQMPLMPLSAKAKAHPRSTAQVLLEDTPAPEYWEETEVNMATNEHVQVLQQRMTNMENAMQEILSAVRSQAWHTPWVWMLKPSEIPLQAISISMLGTIHKLHNQPNNPSCKSSSTITYNSLNMNFNRSKSNSFPRDSRSKYLKYFAVPKVNWLGKSTTWAIELWGLVSRKVICRQSMAVTHCLKSCCHTNPNMYGSVLNVVRGVVGVLSMNNGHLPHLTRSTRNAFKVSHNWLWASRSFDFSCHTVVIFTGNNPKDQWCSGLLCWGKFMNAR